MGRNAPPRIDFGAQDLGLVGEPATLPVRRKGRGLIRLGVLALVLGTVAFVGGFVLMGINAFEAAKDGIDPAADLDLSVAVPGEGAVELEAGRYQVVALGDSLISVSGRSSDAGGLTPTRLPFAETPVTVTGANGIALALEAPSHERLSSTPGLDVVGISEFTAPSDGTYTLVVGGESAAVTMIGIDEADSLWDSAEPWIRSSVVTAVGGVLMSVGAIVLVSGIVRSALGTGLGELRRFGRMR